MSDAHVRTSHDAGGDLSRNDAVSKDDIKATAASFINDQTHALAAVGGIQ
jgi:hypothetical protein